eukprot:520683-Rhodomonas_salina.1
MREQHQPPQEEDDEFPEADDYEILDDLLESEDSGSPQPPSPQLNAPTTPSLTPSSWTDVSSTAPTTPASGYQFGLDLDALSPRPGTGSTRLKTPMTIPEFDGSDCRFSPSSDAIAIWKEETKYLPSAGTHASPRAPLTPRDGADTGQVSGPWHRRWVPPAKGLRAPPKRWFPLQSRFELPIEAQQMHATGKVAGRPYAEKLKSLKEGDVSMGKNVAKEEDEQSPGKTPRWMHDMYMSPWELHERLNRSRLTLACVLRKGNGSGPIHP